MGRLPAKTTWTHLVGLSAVAGVGFTVSLFVSGLAFSAPEQADLAKVGIFVGSAVAGVIGSLILLTTKNPRNPASSE
jgi:NhaA family Na+:H+ antiporter